MSKGDPLDAWLSDVPPTMRPWLKKLLIGTVLFGTLMSVLWYFHG